MSSGLRASYAILIALLRAETRVIGSRRHTLAELKHVLTLVVAGCLRPVVHRVLPLRDAATAHELLASRAHTGKRVLVP